MSGLVHRTGAGNTEELPGAASPDTEVDSGESKAGAWALWPELKFRGGWELEKSTGSVCSLGAGPGEAWGSRPGAGAELLAE